MVELFENELTEQQENKQVEFNLLRHPKTLVKNHKRQGCKMLMATERCILTHRI